jgi:hypothetical protein
MFLLATVRQDPLTTSLCFARCTLNSNINLSIQQFYYKNDTRRSGQSFHSYLQRFPAAQRIDIDLDDGVDPLSSLQYLTKHAHDAESDSVDATLIERKQDEQSSDITSLSVQLSSMGRGSVLWRTTRSAPALISTLTQILHFPKLKQLHVTFRYDLDYYDEHEEEENQRWFYQFESLAAAAETWTSLAVVKVCVRVGFEKDYYYLGNLNLWVSTSIVPVHA